MTGTYFHFSASLLFSAPLAEECAKRDAGDNWTKAKRKIIAGDASKEYPKQHGQPDYPRIDAQKAVRASIARLQIPV